MNNRRSNQVLIGNIWFCFVRLCCHPITRMTWKGRPCRRRRTRQGSVCCHRMLSSMSDIWYPMTTRMSVKFVFLSLLPLCFFFYFFLSFPEERGRYYTNGLRFDLLFYLFPGYKLPYLLPQIYLRYLSRSLAGHGRSNDGLLEATGVFLIMNPVPEILFYCSQWQEVCQELLLVYSNSWKDCHEADHDWLTCGRDLILNLRWRVLAWHFLSVAMFEIRMDDQWIVKHLV